MPDAGMLTVARVAELRGVDHSTAWRLLIQLEKHYGAHLVRKNRTIRISHEELQQSLARMPPIGTARMQREVNGLRRRVSALETEVQRFRKIANEWFKNQR